MPNAAGKIAPKPRYTVVMIPRGRLNIGIPAAVEPIEKALNDPQYAHCGLEGMYAIECATVIVWRTA